MFRSRFLGAGTCFKRDGYLTSPHLMPQWKHLTISSEDGQSQLQLVLSYHSKVGLKWVFSYKDFLDSNKVKEES